jgi:hypothetical protein
VVGSFELAVDLGYGMVPAHHLLPALLYDHVWEVEAALVGNYPLQELSVLLSPLKLEICIDALVDGPHIWVYLVVVRSYEVSHALWGGPALVLLEEAEVNDQSLRGPCDA